MNSLRAFLMWFAGTLSVGQVCADDAQPTETTRCGWFSNPTPANAWLQDGEAEWTIGTQGGRQAKGDWPNFKPSQWVRTNGNYGYGCVCMKVVVDSRTYEITVIKSARTQSLAVCRKDRSLKAPS